MALLSLDHILSASKMLQPHQCALVQHPLRNHSSARGALGLPDSETAAGREEPAVWGLFSSSLQGSKCPSLGELEVDPHDVVRGDRPFAIHTQYRERLLPFGQAGTADEVAARELINGLRLEVRGEGLAAGRAALESPVSDVLLSGRGEKETGVSMDSKEHGKGATAWWENICLTCTEP